MAWTDERIGQLKKLWGKGLSASQIAAELGEGVTRNAVIGKAHRLSLESRPSPVKTGKAKPAKTRAKAVEPQKEKKVITILDLSERICKWPIGHPDIAGFHFCGKPSNPGFPYCEPHCAEAYQAQMPRRDNRRAR